MIDFPLIASAALEQAETLVPRWLPAGRRNGAEWLVGDLAGNAGSSLSINLRTGRWADFAGDVRGGDLISLYAAINGLEQLAAARALSEIVGVASSSAPAPANRAPSRPEWTQVCPVPLGVPTPPPLRHHVHGDPVASWCYLNADGRPIGWIARYQRADGGKEILPRTWVTNAVGESKWAWTSFAKPRPLYGLDRLAARPDAGVVVVEGEKCADVMAELGACAVSWPGGCQAVRHVDWTPLAGRTVTIWPDADDAGKKAAKTVKELLEELGCTVHVVTPPAGKDGGWDVADAVNEGWTAKEVREMVEAARQPAPPQRNDEQRADRSGAPFDLLGYDDGTYYYFPHALRQIVALSAAAHRSTELLRLAPLQWWEDSFPSRGGAEGSVAWISAANALMQRQTAVGVFDPFRLRGRGAWLDAGRVVYHAGDQLYVDGSPKSIEAVASTYLYQTARAIPCSVLDPLPEDEAGKLVSLLSLSNLAGPMDPLLLAGWLVCAPICGALDWRPHIWLSGKAGSGKTVLIDQVIQRILGDAAVIAQGTSTTEAGIRQSLRSDAFPVVIDEAETENKLDQERIQRILMLARQASRESRAKIIKGSAGGDALEYTVRSMFLFASIGVAATQRADLSRLTLMEMDTQRHIETPGAWPKMQAAMAMTTLDDQWCAALRSRALTLAPVIAANAKVFATACAAHLGGQRDGDQIGALLAGAVSLRHDRVVSLAEATDWCSRQEWQAFRADPHDMDEQRALTVLLAAIVRHEEHDRVYSRSVSELVRQASGYVDQQAARTTLERHGMALRRDGSLDVADSHPELKKVFADTPFAGKWSDQLRRLPGAGRVKTAWFGGLCLRATRLPSSMFGLEQEE